MKHKPVEGDKKSFHETGIMGDVYNSIKRAQAALDEDPFTGTGTSLVGRDIQKKLEQYEKIRMLSVDSGLDRFQLPVLDQITSVTALATQNNGAAQKFMGQSDSLASLASKAIGNSSHIAALDQLASVTALATQNNGAAQKFIEQYKFISSLAKDALSLSATHSVRNMDPLAGYISPKIDIDYESDFNKYYNPIAPLSGFRKEPISRPVYDLLRCIALEHKEDHAESRKERPLIKKKNCPEEVYTPNEDQIRDRLIKALNTYLDDHKKIVQQEIDKLPSNLTEARRKEYDSLMSDYQYPNDESAKIETQDLLLLPEDELRQRLVENPLIRTYIFMGLQTILRERKQSYNDPDFIEAQRRKVAYNFNSYYLDEDTDYLLSYETMRWLERERNDGIVIACTNEQTENIASAIRKPGRKVKLTMDVFKQKIYPEMKKRFPDSKHVSGKKAYCTEIGEKYGVSEKTIRDKFDECNLGE